MIITKNNHVVRKLSPWANLATVFRRSQLSGTSLDSDRRIPHNAQTPEHFSTFNSLASTNAFVSQLSRARMNCSSRTTISSLFRMFNRDRKSDETGKKASAGETCSGRLSGFALSRSLQWRGDEEVEKNGVQELENFETARVSLVALFFLFLFLLFIPRNTRWLEMLRFFCYCLFLAFSSSSKNSYCRTSLDTRH